MFKDIELKHDGVYEIKKDKEENEFTVKVANYMSVINQEVNLDTSEHFVNLEFQPINDSEHRLLKVQAADIVTYHSLNKLASKGLDVNEVNKQKVIKALRQSRENAPYIQSHQTLGFVQRNNQLVFNHQVSYGLDAASSYVGPLDIQPKGDEDIYMDMIQSEVIGTLGLELALVFGVSSAMLGFINTQYPMESLMVHLVGSSSCGKSTTAILAASIWGNCNLRENGLISSFNTTLNALQKRLSGNFGVVQCLDELNQYSGNDITKLIYSLSEGRIRSRLNKECEINQLESWNTLILSTGEKSILGMATQNEGLRVRLFEFTMPQWTKSAENSNQIKSITAQNYGWLGLRFIQKLDELGTQRVVKIYNSWKEYFCSKLKETPFTDRVAAKIAILLTSAQILHDEMELSVDVEKIQEFLLTSVDDGLVKIDLAQKAYDRLMEYISTNRTLFSTESKQRTYRGHEFIPSNCKGKIFLDTQGNIEKVAIQISTFKEILNSLGFESPKLVLDKWKDRDWLQCESGRTSTRIMINNTKVGCYVLKVQVASQALGY